MLKDPSARALYLFPTKALANDQRAELDETLKPPARRDPRLHLRRRHAPGRPQGHPGPRPHRPDQPGHAPQPASCRTTPSGSSSSRTCATSSSTSCTTTGASSARHLANVLRRLKRIAAFYGANPQFILCTATIANPVEMAERMIEAPAALVDDNGAPRGEKYFLFYNPPVVNAALGIRRSYVNETRRIASIFLRNDLQTIVFAQSRLIDRSPADLPEGGHREDDQGRGPDPGLPRRLPADQAPRDRERPARGEDPGRRLHQRPGAGHRHRHPGRGRPGRLPGHHRLDLAAGRPGRPQDRRLGRRARGQLARRWTSSSSTTPTTSSAASRRRPSSIPTT